MAGYLGLDWVVQWVEKSTEQMAVALADRLVDLMAVLWICLKVEHWVEH
jgi:hypothetical protein